MCVDHPSDAEHPGEVCVLTPHLGTATRGGTEELPSLPDSTSTSLILMVNWCLSCHMLLIFQSVPIAEWTTLVKFILVCGHRPGE